MVSIERLEKKTSFSLNHFQQRTISSRGNDGAEVRNSKSQFTGKARGGRCARPKLRSATLVLFLKSRKPLIAFLLIVFLNFQSKFMNHCQSNNVSCNHFYENLGHPFAKAQLNIVYLHYSAQISKRKVSKNHSLTVQCLSKNC